MSRIPVSPLLIPMLAVLVRCGGDTGVTEYEDPPELAVLPETLDFGEVEVGHTRDLPFTVRNDGGGTLSGTVSSPCPEFRVVGDSSYSLASGQSRVLIVRFSPESAAPMGCTLVFADDSLRTLNCGGTGVRLCCSSSPVVVDFDTVDVDTYRDRDFVISNCGTGVLEGNLREYCRDFWIVEGGGPFALDPGGTKRVTVRHYASSPGVDTCTIGMGDSPCAEVVCVSVAIYPCCSLVPGGLNFGATPIGDTAVLAFTISNCGTTILRGTVGDILPDFKTCSEFHIVSGGGPYTLHPGEARTVSVQYQAADTGFDTCYVALGEAACRDVACYGNGVSGE